MTEPLDLKINGSSSSWMLSHYFVIVFAIKDVKREGLYNLRRQTPHVDTPNNNNNNKIFLVEMLSYRPSELEEHRTHLY